jgi:hypothetical protein
MPKCRPTLIPLEGRESYVHHPGGFNTRIAHAIFVILSVITALLMKHRSHRSRNPAAIVRRQRGGS